MYFSLLFICLFACLVFFAVDGINRVLKSIFQDILKMNHQSVRENVLSCIIIDIHDFLQMDGIINKKIIRKKKGDEVMAVSDRYLKSKEKNNSVKRQLSRGTNYRD
jgi:hypothetical protein